MFFLVVFYLNVMSRPKTRFLVSFKTLHFQKSPTRKSVVWVFSSLFLSFCYVDTKNRMGEKNITTEIITSVCASGHSCVFVWLWLRLEYVFTKLQQLL